MSVRRKVLIGTTELMRLTDITPRQVEYWIRKGLIIPEVKAVGSGTQHLFDLSVVDQIEDLKARIEACPFNHRWNRR